MLVEEEQIHATVRGLSFLAGLPGRRLSRCGLVDLGTMKRGPATNPRAPFVEQRQRRALGLGFFLGAIEKRRKLEHVDVEDRAPRVPPGPSVHRDGTVEPLVVRLLERPNGRDDSVAGVSRRSGVARPAVAQRKVA